MKFLVKSKKIEGVEAGSIIDIEEKDLHKYVNLGEVVQGGEKESEKPALSKPKLEGSTPKAK